jgi:hypothetical protein
MYTLFFSLDEPFNGQVKEEDGKLVVYFRRKGTEPGDWHELANFSTSVAFHAMNEIEGRSKCLIFRCVVKADGEADKTFFVPLARDDCDTFSSMYAVFKARKKGYNAMVDANNPKKQSIFRAHIIKMMNEYESGGAAQKKGALVAEKERYLNDIFN